MKACLTAGRYRPAHKKSDTLREINFCPTTLSPIVARKLPVQTWHGNHAASAQAADKAEGRVSDTDMPRQKPPATKLAVTAAAVTAPPTPQTSRVNPES